MAIDAYTGLPGAGKSHGVMQRVILPALKLGRTVLHNLPINEAEIDALALPGTLLKVPDGADFDQVVKLFPAGAVLVLDEFWRFMPSGKKAHMIPEEHREFFAMHRHQVGADGRSSDIVLVCQDLSQVCTFVRDLVETTFRYVKQTVIGQRNRYRCDVYQGPVTGAKPPTSKRTGVEHGKYDPAVFKLYRSHTLSTTGAAGVEEKVDDRGNLLKGARFKLTLLALILIPFLLVASVKLFYAQAKPPQKPRAPTPTAERSEAVASAAPAPAEPIARPPTPSHTWRMAGTISRRNGVVVVLQSLTGVRYLPRSACLDDDGGNPVCTLDGELIASWTGAPESTVFGQATATREAVVAGVP